MKRVMIAAALGVASFGVVPAAKAADVITITGASGTFGNSDVSCATPAPCGFTSTFNFITPIGYNLTSSTISSVMTGNDLLTNIDFTSVMLNGVDFATVSTGVVEFRDLLNQAMTQGASNTIVVQGTSGGNASFAGTLSFAQSAVPEPATWALMILGFGIVGFGMRMAKRRSDVKFDAKIKQITYGAAA